MINPGWISLFAEAWKKLTKGEEPPAAGSIRFLDAADVLQWDSSAEPPLYKLLHWDVRYASTLPGRDAEMQALKDWAFNRHGFHIGILSGPGGSGKSRLAAEFCALLAEHNWVSGFLRGLPPEEAPGWLGGSFCFVIDYPEEKGELLRGMLERLRSWLNDGRERDVRILLLARENSEQQLRALLDDADFVHEVSHIGLRPLRALDDEAALELARQVVKAVGGKHEAFAEDISNLEDRLIDWLARDRWQHGLPLFVIAATLHALMEPERGFDLSRAELLGALARREMRRVRRVSESLNLGREALPRLLGLTLLAGGLDGAAIQRLRRQDGLGENALNEDALRQTPWWNGERNSLVLEAPDRPAAAFIAKALLEQPHANLPEWLWLALQDVANDFVERLPRLLWDIGEFDKEAKDRLSTALQEMIQNDQHAPERAKAFGRLTQQQNYLTARLAITIGHVLLAHVKKDDPYRASLLNNLSIQLILNGRHAEALEKAQNAVELFRYLAKDKPQIFLYYLALSLNNLANILSELRKREEAFEKAQESVKIRRLLAKDNPKAFRADLAKSLNNLANIFYERGQYEEALKKAEEAGKIYRDLFKNSPQTFRADLAMNLNSLANIFSALRQHKKALKNAHEAVNFYRQLSEDSPETFRSDLALSLNTLANCLFDLKQLTDALKVAQEAADIYRQLTKDDPQAFGPNLALSLGILGKALMELEQEKEARKAFAEGLLTITSHAQAHPAMHRPLAKQLQQDYLKACEAAGVEPDEELLAPLEPVLEALQERSGKE